MAKKVKPRPPEYHSVTPAIVVPDAAKAIAFYERAFGAKELVRMPGPDGHGIMHAEIRIGDSPVMLADEAQSMGAKAPGTLGAPSGSLHVYVEDVDREFRRALKAGAREVSPPQDMFWGDRYARVEDPFGHQWGIATHVEDVSPAEMAKRSESWAREMAARRPG